MPRILRLENLQQFTAINVLSDPGVIGGPVVIPNAIKFMPVWTLADGKQARNIIGMSVGAGFTPTPTIAESMRAALVAGTNWSTLAGFLAPTVGLARVELLDIRTPNNTVVSSTGASSPGTSAGTALPSETAAVITLRTGKTGPGFRGRLYIPGWATNAIGAGDVIAAGAVTAVNLFCTNISNAITAGSGGWVLLQPARQAYVGSTGTSHPARAAQTTPITSSSCRDNHWDSQRRRGLK